MQISQKGSQITPVHFIPALIKSASTDSLQSLLPEEIVSRLLGGVSFGYGSFQVKESVTFLHMESVNYSD